jgi:hypothetical protein
MNIVKIFSFIITILLLASCTSDTNKPTIDYPQNNIPFINPAFKEVNIPFEEYSFIAEEGDTLFYKTGSILLFPPNSLIDKSGNVVSGKVKIRYREFLNPLDFFISGIPMEYDSSGTKYIFESAGMCEINAYKDDVPVYVNPKSKPEINLATNNHDAAFNLYFLDTIHKEWINKGKDFITDLGTDLVAKSDNETSNQSLPLAPNKPIKSDGVNPVFSIVIEPGSVPELQAYNNLKFEIDKDEKKYNPKDADEDWEDVKVERGNKAGTYKVTFINSKRKVSYITRPVFEGKDYDEALKVFDKKDKEYRQLLVARLSKEAEEKEEIEKIQKENERIKKMNLLIEARNKQTERLNKQIEKNNEIAANKKALAEQQKNQMQGEFESGGVRMFGAIIRTFQIEGFGVWNSDSPTLLSGKRAITLVAHFIDENNNPLQLNMVQVMYKGFNGINAHHDPSADYSYPRLYVIPNSENMIWAVLNNKFYYIDYADFKKYNITSVTKEQTFTMRTHPDRITSAEDIKKIVGL